MLGGMQDWPLRIMRLLDHAEREHGSREIVSRYAAGDVVRTDWAGIARVARRLAKALERMGIRRGDRKASIDMNHGSPLVDWYGATGRGGALPTQHPSIVAERLNRTDTGKG